MYSHHSDPEPGIPIEQMVYGYDVTEPKIELMNLPKWDGDPSSWRDYQQEARSYKKGENLEVSWSGAARLVGGLKGGTGVAITDQELLRTARNITHNGERKADRNRRGFEAYSLLIHTSHVHWHRSSQIFSRFNVLQQLFFVSVSKASPQSSAPIAGTCLDEALSF